MYLMNRISSGLIELCHAGSAELHSETIRVGGRGGMVGGELELVKVCGRVGSFAGDLSFQEKISRFGEYEGTDKRRVDLVGGRKGPELCTRESVEVHRRRGWRLRVCWRRG